MKENLIAGRSALERAKTGKEFNCGVVYTPDDIAREPAKFMLHCHNCETLVFTSFPARLKPIRREGPRFSRG